MTKSSTATKIVAMVMATASLKAIEPGLALPLAQA